MTTARPALGLALALLLLPACDGAGRPPAASNGAGQPAADGAATPADAALALLTADPPADGEAAGAAPAEIYYDLTIFDWYRRGEPLVHESTAFEPRGTPAEIPAAELRRLGRYQGVDYYVPQEAPAPHSVVYVPVFENFWQPFVAPEAAPPPADTR